MIWRKLLYLWPPYRRARELEMREELESLAEIGAAEEPSYTGRPACTLAAENARAAWGWAWLDSIAKDLHYAFRVLARDRSFTVVAVLSLGLGIGANAAIFSLMDTLLLRQLPIYDPGRLVSFARDSYSYPSFVEYRAKSGEVLAGVAATSDVSPRDFDTGGSPERRYLECVSAEYFDVLGVQALLGRTILPTDGQVAVISYGYWQRAFGRSPAVLGQTIRIQKTPFTITGVAPPEFFGVTVGQAADAWISLTDFSKVYPGLNPLNNDHFHFLNLLGRLKPGITAGRASAALTPLTVAMDRQGLRPDVPASVRQEVENEKLELIPAGKGLSSLRKRFSEPLRLVFAMVAIGLLLACVNVMGLQFARADQRRKELSVRLAIGAGRQRIVRQLLTEALVVASLGGLLGLAICRPAAASLVSLLSMSGNPVQLDLGIRSSMLLFVGAVSVLAALVCGVVPAMRATRGELLPGLQQGSRAATSAPRRKILGRAVASLQLALSVVLIAGAFLFAFSLYRLLQFDTGLDRRNLLVVSLDTVDAGLRGPQIAALDRRLVERLRSRPGIQSVSFSENGIYLTFDSNTGIDADGFQSANFRDHMSFRDNIGPRYFATVGARLVSGRDFEESDGPGADRVAIVNQEFAARFFQGKDPLGQTFYSRTPDNRIAYRVVGVVRDIRNDVRKRPRIRFYQPALQAQSDFPGVRFLVRTKTEPANVISDLRAAIRTEDPRLRIESISTGDQLLDRTLDLDRLIAALSFAFGILALTLAAVGIYGLMAYDVTRRTGEIGIRMALGASRRSVMALVFREVGLVAAAGITVGAAAALATGRLVAGLVFELKPGDPRVLAAAAVVLAAAAASAAWIPARRASRMDPMRALRVE
ncbi:MAG TPA: ABC transporter permease [Bryobacteraceae bacterium]